MTFTTEQLELRRRTVNASEAGAICCVNPYCTVRDVYAFKLGLCDELPGNDATDAGTRLERSVLEWAVDELGAADPQFGLQFGLPWLRATLDACATWRGEIVNIEAKTAGICGPLDYDAWGPAGTDEVPETYQVQCQVQMACMGPECRRTFLAALLPPRGFVLYELVRDDDLIAAIVARLRWFWFDCVQARVEPQGEMSLEVAKRLRRTPGKTVQLPPGVAENYVFARDAHAVAENRRDSAKAELLAALGDAEHGTYACGRVDYTYRKRPGGTPYRALHVRQDKRIVNGTAPSMLEQVAALNQNEIEEFFQ